MPQKLTDVYIIYMLVAEAREGGKKKVLAGSPCVHVRKREFPGMLF